MDIYVFDFGFNMMGLVDIYESLIIQRNYATVSTIELHATADDNNIALLQKGRILLKSNNPTEGYFIVARELSEETTGKMIIRGYSLNRLLKKRIVWGQQSKSGTIEQVMKYFVDKNAINPAIAARKLPNLILSADRGLPFSSDEGCSYRRLDEYLFEIGNKFEISNKIDIDLTNKQYLFDVWQGLDRSISQSTNPRVIFSTDFENVVKQQYTDSDNDYSNMALVAGEGEDINRRLVLVNDTSTGWNRDELYVDARDLSSTQKDDAGNDIVLTDSAYNSLLAERGNAKLTEVETIQTFESEVIPNSNFIYRQDYDLGDVVTTMNEKWGLTLNTRITSIEEVYENNNLSVKVTFGKNIPTLIDKINRKLR